MTRWSEKTTEWFVINVIFLLTFPSLSAAFFVHECIGITALVTESHRFQRQYRDAQGPADFSTTSRASYTRRRGDPSESSRASAAGSARRDSARSGWKENNAVRDHPWAHPGQADPPASTYTDTTLPPRSPAPESPLSVPSPGGRRDGPPRAESGFSRHTHKVVLGPGPPDPPAVEDLLSTTHLAYVAGRRPRGRTGPPAPLSITAPPGSDTLGESGYCRAYNIDPELVIPHSPSSPASGAGAAGHFSTTAAADFVHPAARAGARRALALPAAGAPSGYARAVAPLDALASPPPQARLHPTVLAAQAKRDPKPYFGAGSSPDPALRTASEAPGSPASESVLARSPAGLTSGRLSVLATVLRS